MATAVVVLLVMCGTGSAGHIGISKDTNPSGAMYRIGDPVTYVMTVCLVDVTGSPGYSIDVVLKDTYPNGTVETWTCTLQEGGVESVQYTRTYVVDENDILAGVYAYPGEDVILNKINATGYWPGDGVSGDYAETPCESKILSDPTADFDFVAGLCNRMVTFTPNATDPGGIIMKYEWDYGNDGSIDRTETNDNPFTDGPFPPGCTDVKLTVTDDDDLTDSIVKPVCVNSPPTISSLTASKTKVEVPPGAMVTFTGTGSDPDGDALTYTWAITNSSGTHIVEGPATFTGSSTLNYFVDEIPTTAILTITDPNNCVATASARVGKLEERVPLLTLPGLLALIGMMCIVGAGRIITRGRRS
jgi:hypothetical protein